MKKTIRLTESDLTRIVIRVISETTSPTNQTTNKFPHPMDNKFYLQMLGDVQGDGVETIEYIPNKKLVIDAFGNKYTITKS